jgi:hypothetical protein
MTSFDKDYKRLYRVYNKKLKNLHKNSFKHIDNGMEYFITYLRFMRDYLILTEGVLNEEGHENIKISTIATAIAEYELYENCINKYFKHDGKTVIRIAPGTDEEVQKKYAAEKQFHWNCFWEITRLNMMNWRIK